MTRLVLLLAFIMLAAVINTNVASASLLHDPDGVSGELYLDGFLPVNLFDPAFGLVPNAVGNENGATGVLVVDSGTVEFQAVDFLSSGLTVDVDLGAESVLITVSSPGSSLGLPGGQLWLSDLDWSEDANGRLIGVDLIHDTFPGGLGVVTDPHSLQFDINTSDIQSSFVYSAQFDLLTIHDDPPDPEVIPEPSTFSLALMGMLMLSCHGRRRRRR